MAAACLMMISFLFLSFVNVKTTYQALRQGGDRACDGACKWENIAINNSKCAEDWCKCGNSCYYVSTSNETSWFKASEHCDKFGSDLVKIDNQEENTFLVDYLGMKVGGTYWIGLNAIANPGIYAWEDGSPYMYDNWTTNDYFKDDCGNCAVLKLFTTKNRKTIGWQKRPCDLKKKYVCEKNHSSDTTNEVIEYPPSSNNGCFFGWTKYGNYCYKIFIRLVSDIKNSWYAAQDYCTELGGNLPSFHSLEEYNYLRINMKLGSCQTYWIGLNNNNYNENNPQWTDGSRFNFTTLLKSGHKDEGCLTIQRYSQRWEYKHCSDSYDWICKLPVGVTPGSVDVENKCSGDSEWHYYDSHCYYVMEQTYFSYLREMKTWKDAENFCIEKGGHLASIHSPEENDFVKSLILKRDSNFFDVEFWIGLTSGMVNNSEWSDGSYLEGFENWKDATIKEAIQKDANMCTTIINSNIDNDSAGKWGKHLCDEKLPFVCKRRSSGLPTDTAQKDCPLPIGIIISLSVLSVSVAILTLALAVQHTRTRNNVQKIQDNSPDLVDLVDIKTIRDDRNLIIP